jgi:hypothetical protein
VHASRKQLKMSEGRWYQGKRFDEDEMETMAGDRRLVMILLNQECGKKWE